MRRSGAAVPILAVIVIVAVSCAPHKVPPPAETVPPHSWYWVDLRAGWRVRVVTPLTKSGGHLAKAEAATSLGETRENVQSPGQAPAAATIELKAGKDFIGYEVALYSVKAQREGGVRVVFRSAVITIRGKKTARPLPILPLFRLPRDDKFVRILHLAWGSHGGHNAAILAANRRDLLDALAKKVASGPAACVISADSYCSWIPAGVAVTPERWKRAGGRGRWTAAY
jgi:hypothetical protein